MSRCGLRPRPPRLQGSEHFRELWREERSWSGMSSFEDSAAMIFLSKVSRMSEEMEGGIVMAV